MIPFGEKFQELWADIAFVASYWGYVALANTIDDARTGDEITARDEAVLLEALEVFRKARNIPEHE